MIKEKVIGFVRVSTLKQTLSMKNQVSRIKTYTKDKKLDLVDIIKEEGSGLTCGAGNTDDLAKNILLLSKYDRK